MMQPMIHLLLDAIQDVVLARDWAAAFDADGFGTNPASVSRHIRRHLRWQEPPAVAWTRPTIDELRLCWPRNAVLDEAAVYGALPAPRAMPGHVA